MSKCHKYAPKGVTARPCRYTGQSDVDVLCQNNRLDTGVSTG